MPSVRSLRSSASPAKVCSRTNLRKLGYRLLELKWLSRSSFSSCSRTATLSASLEGSQFPVSWSANIALHRYTFRMQIVLQSISGGDFSYDDHGVSRPTWGVKADKDFSSPAISYWGGGCCCSRRMQNALTWAF